MEEILFQLVFIGIVLLFLSMVFIPMEKAFPARKGQRIFRKQWLLDLCHFLGQYLIWNSLVLWALSYFELWTNSFIPTDFKAFMADFPLWLQTLFALTLSDFFIYWAHRWQHNNDFLWRFHKVHHTAVRMDWLAAHREHPLDTIYTVGIINLPAILLGFNLNSIGLIVAFRGIWAIFIHSNVRIPLGPIKYLIGSPEIHHWHHDLERDRGNYANISPLLDVIFGTFTCPPEEPKAFGIRERFSKTYFGQLLEPLVPKKIWLRIVSKKTH